MTAGGDMSKTPPPQNTHRHTQLCPPPAGRFCHYTYGGGAAGLQAGRVGGAPLPPARPPPKSGAGRRGGERVAAAAAAATAAG